MLGRVLRWPPGFDGGFLPRAARDTPGHRAAFSVITHPLIVVLGHGQLRRPPPGTDTRPPGWPGCAPTRPCVRPSRGQDAELLCEARPGKPRGPTGPKPQIQSNSAGHSSVRRSLEPRDLAEPRVLAR